MNDSFPPETAPPSAAEPSRLDTQELLGTRSGRRLWRTRLRRRRGLWIILAALVVFTWWFVPPVYKLRNGPVTVTRYNKRFGQTKATVGPGMKGWITTEKISKHALHAIIAAEDGKFYEHHGFDFEAIRRSYEFDRKRHKFARGASTISQQVVKMAFLTREKTLIRKAREAAGTAIMELILPKDKILEWYINLAEFGDGVYGIEEGCWHYFKTKPELLTIEQSVHLALVLPSPNAWSRGLKRRSLTAFGQRRFAAIVNTMRAMGYVTKTQWTTALTRGDFGRPILGYAALLAADQTNQVLCPGSPGCPESTDDDLSDDEAETPVPPSALSRPGTSTGTGTGTHTNANTNTNTNANTGTSTVTTPNDSDDEPSDEAQPEAGDAGDDADAGDAAP